MGKFTVGVSPTEDALCWSPASTEENSRIQDRLNSIEACGVIYHKPFSARLLLVHEIGRVAGEGEVDSGLIEALQNLQMEFGQFRVLL